MKREARSPQCPVRGTHHDLEGHMTPWRCTLGEGHAGDHRFAPCGARGGGSTKVAPESTAAALGVALANDRHRWEHQEREMWSRAAYYVRLGLPLSAALRILGCSRATWYRKTAEFRREEEM